MGAGKTTVGRKLAARARLGLRDSDADIQAAKGLTVRRARDQDGIDAMHGLEAAQLLEALGRGGPSVIGAAAKPSSMSPSLRQAALRVADGRRLAPRVAGGPRRAPDRLGATATRPPTATSPGQSARDQLDARGRRWPSMADDVDVASATDELRLAVERPPVASTPMTADGPP